MAVVAALPNRLQASVQAQATLLSHDEAAVAVEDAKALELDARAPRGRAKARAVDATAPRAAAKALVADVTAPQARVTRDAKAAAVDATFAAAKRPRLCEHLPQAEGAWTSRCPPWKRVGAWDPDALPSLPKHYHRLAARGNGAERRDAVAQRAAAVRGASGVVSSTSGPVSTASASGGKRRKT